MQFTNLLWSSGFEAQAMAYWNAYCAVAGLAQ
jgi:hypothetical protein